jgi:hypothetical protein
MRVKNFLPLVILVFSACQGVTGLVLEDHFEMGEPSLRGSNELSMEPKTVVKERREFVEKLMRAGKDKRRLYEEYLNVIGANGILDGIEKVWPDCHTEAHDAGRAIFAEVRDIGTSLRICADRCFTGCMHGVLMEAFSDATEKTDPDRHINLRMIKPAMNEVCYKNPEMVSSYSPGNCAHGVGHAVMFLARYKIPEALETCTGFEDPAMRYYCATGAYMEYVTERDAEDAKTKSLHYPCDTYAYPVACSRYKMYYVADRYYQANRSTKEIVQECEKLTGKFRLGCFHGLGNAHMWPIARGEMSIRRVCGNGTENDRLMCIEGAMERLGWHHEKRALAVCEDLKSKDRQVCVTAVKHKMYDMTKDYSLYLSE